jgi:hypothetical protein
MVRKGLPCHPPCVELWRELDDPEFDEIFWELPILLVTRAFKFAVDFQVDLVRMFRVELLLTHHINRTAEPQRAKTRVRMNWQETIRTVPRRSISSNDSAESTYNIRMDIEYLQRI